MPPRSPTRSVSAALLAAEFLLPVRSRRIVEDTRWRSAARWMTPLGLLIGITYALLFGLTWAAFGEYHGIRWVPVLAVLIADVAVCGYRLLTGTAAVASRRFGEAPTSQAPLTLPALLTVVLVVLAKFALLVSLPAGVWQDAPPGAWEQSSWAYHLGPLYPGAVYRPLILMPLWGRWALLLAISIGRVSPAGSPRLQQIAAGVKLPAVLCWWLGVAALTLFYCSGSSTNLGLGVATAMGVTLPSYLAAFILARRAGGQTEATVNTTGLVAELGFLALYLAVCSNIYWY